MKRIFFSLICIFSFLTLMLKAECSFCQVEYVTVGIDGMTCSACSYGTEKSIRKLEFVKDVKMDLNSTQAKIFFVEGKKISLDAVAKKITDAGFSVRSVDVTYNFRKLQVSDHFCYNSGNMIWSFLDVKDETLDGPVTLHVIGNSFMPSSEMKRWKVAMDTSCKGTTAGEPVYLVTLLENHL